MQHYIYKFFPLKYNSRFFNLFEIMSTRLSRHLILIGILEGGYFNKIANETYYEVAVNDDV